MTPQSQWKDIRDRWRKLKRSGPQFRMLPDEEIRRLLVEAFESGEKLGRENYQKLYWHAREKEDAHMAARNYADSVLLARARD